MLLVPHFSLEELAVTNTSKYQRKNLEEAKQLMGKMYQLAGFAERVREIVGHPLIVTSGFRCKELNSFVGGSANSQHLLCEAIDIVCNKMTVKSLYSKIKNSDLKYEQMIIETNSKGSQWLHISIGSKKERLEYNGGKYTKLK